MSDDGIRFVSFAQRCQEAMRGVGVVVVQVHRLVGIGSVKGDALVDVGVAVPDAVATLAADRAAVTAAAVDVGEGVSGVKERHAVDEVTNRAEAGGGVAVEGARGAWNTVGGGGIAGEAREVLGLCLVEIPGAHDMESQPAGPDVDPVGIMVDLVHPGVGRRGLVALPAAPGGRGGARRLIFLAGEDTCVFAALLSIPGTQLRFGGGR